MEWGFSLWPSVSVACTGSSDDAQERHRTSIDTRGNIQALSSSSSSSSPGLSTNVGRRCVSSVSTSLFHRNCHEQEITGDVITIGDINTF